MNFEFDAGKYQKASAHQKEWGEKLINELDLAGDERILDLGCGDGAITEQLAAIAPRGEVVGIDGSQNMIEAARHRQRPNLSFVRMDINSLEFTDEFDLVFSNATLHWIKDHTRLLANIHACLRENGTVRLNFAADGNCSHLIEVLKTAVELAQYSGYFADFDWPWYLPTVTEYEALLRQSPFRDARVWGEPADRYFADADAMVQWIDQPALVPFIKSVGESDKQHFRDFVVEHMIKETLQEDGTCFETFRRVNVLAGK